MRTVDAVSGGSSHLCLLQLLSPHWKEKEQLILTGMHHQNMSIARKLIHPAYSPSYLIFQWMRGADPPDCSDERLFDDCFRCNLIMLVLEGELGEAFQGERVRRNISGKSKQFSSNMPV